MVLYDPATIAGAASRTFARVPDATLGGYQVPTFRRSDFRWRWFATRLHTFAFIFDLPDSFPDDGVIALGEEAREHARTHKGGLPRGLQTGTAAMPIFMRNQWPASALYWAREPQRVRFASILFPVLVSTERVQTAYRWKPQRMGRVYEHFLRGQAEALVGPATAL